MQLQVYLIQMLHSAQEQIINSNCFNLLVSKKRSFTKDRFLFVIVVMLLIFQRSFRQRCRLRLFR